MLPSSETGAKRDFKCHYASFDHVFIQVAVLNAEVSLANARVTNAESDKDRCYTHLIAAEARADRVQSMPAHAVRAPSMASEKEENKPDVKEEVKEEDRDTNMPALASMETNDRSIVNGHGPTLVTEDDQYWKSRYEACDKRNQELTEELMELKSRCSELTSEVTKLHSVWFVLLTLCFLRRQLAAPSVETLQKSPLYDSLIQRLQYLKQESDTCKQKCAELAPQVDQLRESQDDFKEKLIVRLQLFALYLTNALLSRRITMLDMMNKRPS